MEEFLCPFIILRVSAIGVSQKLVNACFHRVRDIRRLTLDHCQRHSIHEQDNVRDDVLINARNLELVCTDKLVVLKIGKIDDVNRLTFVALAKVLHDRHALINRGPDCLICFDQIGVLGLGQVFDDLLQILITDPRIDAFDVRSKSVF